MRIFRIAMALALLLAFQQGCGAAPAAPTSPSGTQQAAGFHNPPPDAQLPGDVRVGIFLFAVHDLDLAHHAFRVAFNIWWRFKGDGFDPLAALQVLNARTQTFTLEDRRKLPDGDTYVAARVEATIEQVLDTSAFPFDRHRLKIELESPYEDDHLRYVVDATGSMLDPEVYSPGWRITDFAIREERKQYPTSFGLPERTEDRYSRAVIEVSASHVSWGHAIDYFIGFITSVLICLLTFLVHPRLLPPRATMIGTAVFAAVGNKYVVNSLTNASFGSRPVNIVVVTAFSMVLIQLLTSIACERMIEKGNLEQALRTNRNIGIAAACGCLLVTFYVAQRAIYG